ncbi:hypothetical protein TNCV_5015121 [Trichonephila clavipes]|nr:hypothetical protein TNCV_5015121 [Trichonephila clavipes]
MPSQGFGGRGSLVVKVKDWVLNTSEFQFVYNLSTKTCRGDSGWSHGVTGDPPCTGTRCTLSLSRLNVIPLVWYLGEGSASSGVVLVTSLKLSIIRDEISDSHALKKSNMSYSNFFSEPQEPMKGSHSRSPISRLSTSPQLPFYFKAILVKSRKE